MHIFTGTAYRSGANNVCNHIGAESEEVAVLTDGDLSTCEIRNDSTVGVFRLFIKHPRRRILVSLTGRLINCSPANGVIVTIVSTSEEGTICQAMLSHFSDRCLYRCFCINYINCSHVMVTIPADGGDICEIIIDWNLTHYARVIWRHRSESTLVMVCCLTATSHCVSQCWLIIKCVLWYSSGSMVRLSAPVH